MSSEITFLAEIAYRYYIEDMSQKDIANRYNIGRTTISRLLKKARELGLVEINIHSIDPKLIQLKDQLQQKYQLRTLELIPTNQTLSRALQLQHFYDTAGNVIRQLVDSNKNIGISWGNTITHH